MARRGFTLMELVMVLAIIIILSALAFPNLEATYASLQADGGADSVRAAWSDGQSHAIEEGRAYRFSHMPGQDKYRLAPDGNEFWSGDGSPTSEHSSETQPYLLDGTLPKRVTFGAPDEGGGWVTTAVFLPDGTVKEDAEVQIVTPGAKTIFVRVRGLTGVITSQRGE